MKAKTSEFSTLYVTALRKHLKQGSGASFQPALKLGREAVTLGLQMLDLARLHEKAISILELKGPASLIKQAEIFFAEATIPMVETYRAARESKIEVSALNKKLNRRTEELAHSNQQMKQGIVRRKSAEAALKKSGEDYTTLLEESLQLQEGLRKLTHRVLVAQEDDRKNISRELQDEIAQTLLGINVRLLTVQQEAQSNTKGLQNEIASTQRMVVLSAKSVRKVARDLRN